MGAGDQAGRGNRAGRPRVVGRIATHDREATDGLGGAADVGRTGTTATRCGTSDPGIRLARPWFNGYAHVVEQDSDRLAGASHRAEAACDRRTGEMPIWVVRLVSVANRRFFVKAPSHGHAESVQVGFLGNARGNSSKLGLHRRFDNLAVPADEDDDVVLHSDVEGTVM